MTGDYYDRPLGFDVIGSVEYGDHLTVISECLDCGTVVSGERTSLHERFCPAHEKKDENRL